MLMMRNIIIAAAAMAAIALASCVPGARGTTDGVGFVPEAPKYADASAWYAIDRGGEVDVFYITSTEVTDWVALADTTDVTCHYADVRNDSIRRLLLAEMRWVGEHYVPDGYNFYSPYYRQISLESWQSDGCVDERFGVACDDIFRSFDYYLAHINGGRPFVLAGFSQGGKGVVELLKHLDSDAAELMVAAYVIGYKVTAADLATGRFVPATGAADLGVTVCYNSVRAPECAVEQISGGNLLCINPLNWRTDTATAALDDTLTVACDPQNHLLIVKGYNAPPSEYVLPLIGKEGNYHHLDLLWYVNALRSNIEQRGALFLERRRTAKQAA